MSSQGLKHAIHSRHKYWHEHAHHDTRHEETQLEDTTWLSSDALKDDEEEKEVGGEKKEKEKSLEGTVASGTTGGGLSAQEGSLVRSCMFGSIQYVHVVNMKAGILYAQREQISEESSTSLLSNSAQWYWWLHSWLHVNRTKTQNEKSKRESGVGFKYSPTFYIRSTTSRQQNKKKEKKNKGQKKWLHVCTRIQRRNTASNRGDKTTCFKVAPLPCWEASQHILTRR